jgi:protein TonB
MFKSVIERQRAGRLGTGVWVSVGVHAALFVAVLFVSARQPEPEPAPPPDRIVIKAHRVSLQPRGTPAVATGTRQVTTQIPRRRRELAPPRQVQPLQPEPVQPAAPEPAPAPTGTEALASTDGEGPVGDPAGGPGDGGGGGDGDSSLIDSGDLGEYVEPFGPGMTPPVMLGGPAIDYTPQALVAGVQGTMLVKCVITQEGEVHDCRTIKGLPHMDAAVMGALEGRRYRPVTFQGKAVSVSYVFTVRLKLPR